MIKSSATQSTIPAWLSDVLAARAAEAVTVVTRTLDEHLAYVAAQQATEGLVWDADTNRWVKWWTKA